MAAAKNSKLTSASNEARKFDKNFQLLFQTRQPTLLHVIRTKQFQMASVQVSHCFLRPKQPLLRALLGKILLIRLRNFQFSWVSSFFYRIKTHTYD